MAQQTSSSGGRASLWLGVLALSGLTVLSFGSTGCWGLGYSGSSYGYSRPYRWTARPQLKIVKFTGTYGYFRLHNTTPRSIRGVVVMVRGYGCHGPTRNRTIFHTSRRWLRPGYYRTFRFSFRYRCQRVRVVTSERRG